MQRPTLLLSLLIALIALSIGTEAAEQGQQKLAHSYAGRTVRRESRMLKKDKGDGGAKSTKAPKVKSTKAPKVKSTKAPKSPASSSGSQVQSSIAVASVVAGAIWFAL